MKIKLRTVIDAIEQASEEYLLYYDPKTKEIVYLPEMWDAGEADEELLALMDDEPITFCNSQ